MDRFEIVKLIEQCFILNEVSPDEGIIAMIEYAICGSIVKKKSREETVSIFMKAVERYYGNK